MRHWPVILFFCGTFMVSAQQDSLVEIEIPIQKTEATLEIIWLQSETSQRGAKVETVTENPLVRAIESRYRYFRIRPRGLEGQSNTTSWGKVYPVDWFVVGRNDKKYIVVAETSGDEGPALEIKKLGGRDYLLGKSISYEQVAEKKTSNKIFYQINNTGYRIYSKPLAFEQDGFYLLRFFSENDKGALEDATQVQFYVDRLPPESKVAFSKQARFIGDVFTIGQQGRIDIISQDLVSGVEKIFYRFSDKEEYKEYIGPLSFFGSEFKGVEKQMSIEYYGVDKLGNKETPKKAFFNYDNQAPRIQIVHTQKIRQGKLFKVVVGIKVSEISRPVVLESSVDGKVIERKSVSDYHQLVGNLTTKPYSMTIHATDALGNKSTVKQNLADLPEEIIP